jgi:integrase
MARKPKQQTSIAGFGCIFQRTYRARNGEQRKTQAWYLEYKTRDGAVRRPANTTDQATAYAELARLHGRLHSGEMGNANAETVTFKALFALLDADYLREKRHSYADMKSRVEKWLIPAIGDLKVMALRKTDIQRAVARWRDDLEPASINKLLAYARRAMQLGAEEDPPLVLRVPKGWFRKLECADNARTGIISPEQYDCLKRTMPPHAALALCIGFHTGMRRGLILSMRWDWVDLGAKLIRVPAATNATKKRPRLVPIYGDMTPMLEMARSCATSPWVIEYDGRRIASIKRAWKTACRLCETQESLFHDLRRTAATRLHEAGYDLNTIMDVCGWKSPEMPRRYIQQREARVRDIAAGMDRFMRGELQADSTASHAASHESKNRLN